jgi:hypothetical protein
VPKSCELEIGGSLEREIWRYDRYFYHIFGVNSFGDDCGFGHAAIVPKISAYFNWVDSIVAPNADERVHYQIEEDQGDSCRHTDGRIGKCVAAAQCPDLVNEYKKNRVQINFCSLDQEVKVCCPPIESPSGVVPTKRNDEIDRCENMYKDVYTKIKLNDDLFHSDTMPGYHPSVVSGDNFFLKIV